MKHGFVDKQKMQEPMNIEQPETARKPIIIVEDEAHISELLSELVESLGFAPIVCMSTAQLNDELAQTKPALILLDRQLPDGDGISCVGKIVEREIPLIVLTGKGSEIDRVTGLEVGADDYIVKPFSIHEVAARIRAVLRRSDRGQSPNNNQDQEGGYSVKDKIRDGFEFAGFLMDNLKRLVFDAHGNSVDLTVAEFDLLHAIVQGNGRVLSRNQILELTHRTNIEVFDRTIDVLIFRLRKKIENNPQVPAILKTERGVGYKLGVKAEKLLKETA